VLLHMDLGLDGSSRVANKPFKEQEGLVTLPYQEFHSSPSVWVLQPAMAQMMIQLILGDS